MSHWDGRFAFLVGVLAVAMTLGVASVGLAAESGEEDVSLFDPKRPLEAELEMSVADGFTLAAVGDCIISRPLSQRLPSDAGFAAVVKILREADATVGNMESTILDPRQFEGYPYAGMDDWALSSAPAVARDLRGMGFDLVSRANNHAGDWGIEGMRETSRWLDEAGLVHAGAGENRGQARAARYFETEKGRIGLISMASTYRRSSEALSAAGEAPGRPGLNALRVKRSTVVPEAIMESLVAIRGAMRQERRSCEGEAAPTESVDAADSLPSELSLFGTDFRLGESFAYAYEVDELDLGEILRSIRQGKQNADFLIAAIHAHQSTFKCGEPGDFLSPLAHAAIDAGADAFIAHGIHHLGPIEVYKGKPIFYGLANFFWSDIQEPLPVDFHEGYRDRLSRAFPDPSAATDADLTALLNATSFNHEETFQSVVAVSKFERGEVSEIRLYPVDLGYGLRLTQSGVPRLASPSVGRVILERLRGFSEAYGTAITLERNVGIIRPVRAP
jgi:poly-gamma-glutamate synthesis protein (capsule biosynthesis protein)